MRNFNNFRIGKELFFDENGIRAALKAAEEARFKGEHAVGAALRWSNGRMLTDYSTEREEKDVMCHAVVNLLRKGSQMYRCRLDDAILYTTLEPCLLCMAAVQVSGIRELVFGCYDPLNGFSSAKMLAENVDLRFVFRGGVLLNECEEMLPKNKRL